MLTLTSDATQAIEQILTAAGVPSGAGIRITQSPSPDGEAPASELQVLVAEAPDDGDAVIEDEGARVFVEDSVSSFLDDKQLDAQVVDERVRFSLGNGG